MDFFRCLGYLQITRTFGIISMMGNCWDFSNYICNCWKWGIQEQYGDDWNLRRLEFYLWYLEIIKISAIISAITNISTIILVMDGYYQYFWNYICNGWKLLDFWNYICYHWKGLRFLEINLCCLEIIKISGIIFTTSENHLDFENYISNAWKLLRFLELY